MYMVLNNLVGTIHTLHTVGGMLSGGTLFSVARKRRLL